MAAKATNDKKTGGLLGVILPVLVLTLLAGGGGFLVGHLIAGRPAVALTPGIPASGAAVSEPPVVAVRELSPVITNLAAPDGAWLRLQTAIIYDRTDAAQMELIVPKVADDTLAFVRTLTVAQLQGASGLQHLREDLNERAALRSDGRIKEVVIEAMVIQ